MIYLYAGLILCGLLLIIIMISRLRKYHSSKKEETQADIEGLNRFSSEYQITPREQEIIKLIIQGKTNKEIAGELFLSTQTVKNYIHKIFQKIHVNNRGQLTYRIRDFYKAGIPAAAEYDGNAESVPSGSKGSLFPFPLKKMGLFLSVILFFLAAVFIVWHLFDPGSQESALPAKSSLAILPFKDLSPQKDQEYLCDGLVEEIIYRLSHLDALRVPARTSSYAFKGKTLDIKEIGRILDVEHILEGSVRKAEDKLRITVQLININNNDHIWSDQYECQMEDLFAIQDDISMAIINNLKINLFENGKELLTKSHTKNLAAYNSYLKGQWHFNRRTEDDLKKAVNYYEKAVEYDPGYAAAYVGLANSYIIMPDYSSAIIPLEAYRKSKEYTLKALEINDALAEAHAALAMNMYRAEYDWEGAERQFKKAIALNSSIPEAHHWYALLLMQQAHFDEALEKIETARKLDPLSIVVNRNNGVIHYYARRYNQALKELRKTFELDPHFVRTRYFLGKVYLQKSMFGKALSEFQKEKNNFTYWDPKLEAQIGITKARMGKVEEAKTVFAALREKSTSINAVNYESAIICFALGEKKKGLNFLWQAYKHRDPKLCYLKIDPYCDSVRDEPEFQKLQHIIGL
jgi:TolB-like protein/DNA-binding CsgD family transcriptional regulator/Tfp pilus assembly protein PilF